MRARHIERWLAGRRRPTYGYRRISALANRERAKTGAPAINHKRVFRIMQQNGLLLTRHTRRRTGRVHDGKVIVMRSNLRWCSDGFEITCWNGEIVRVAFMSSRSSRTCRSIPDFEPGGKARHEIERHHEVPRVLGGIGAANISEPFDRKRCSDGSEPGLDGLQHHVAECRRHRAHRWHRRPGALGP